MSVGTGFDDFIQDLQGILRAAWGETWGELHEGIPVRDLTKEITTPLIVVVSRREPSKHVKNIKPRPMGTEVDPDRLGLIELYEMWYDMEVEFRIYHNTHASAKRVAASLEEILLSFAGYFKSRGLDEILFLEELEPDVENPSRIPLPCRHLRYYIRLRKEFRLNTNVIREIQGQVNVRANPA